MFRLAVQSLRNRWSRALTAVVGIAMAISIAYVMSGVTAAFESESGRTLRVLGDDFLIPESSAGLINGLVDASDPPEGQEPVLFFRDSLPAKDVDINIFGVEPGVIDTVTEGRTFEEPGELVADVSLGVPIGGTVTLQDQDFEVVGHTDGTRMFGGGPVIYLPLADMQAYYYNGQPLAHFYAVSDSGASEAEGEGTPDGLEAYGFAEAKRDLDRAVQGAISSLALTRTLLWVMVAGVVFVLNRLTLLDRRSELATLKCLGAGTTAMGGSLVMESVVVGLLGAGFGCLVGLGLAPLFPLAVESSALTAQQIVLLAVGVSFAAALIGTLSLRRVAPSDAFRGET